MPKIRPITAVDRVMDGFLDEYAALDPIAATEFGVSGHEERLPDLSPDGLAEISALRRRTLAALDRARPEDAVDRVTVAAAREHLQVAELLRDAGTEESRLNNIESPLQGVRQVFDSMPTATVRDWAAIATRLARVPEAIGGYVASLRTAAADGRISPRRQVQAGIAQSRACTGPDGFFARLAAGAGPRDGVLPDSVRRDLERGARAAAAAYEELARFLADELLPKAPDEDAVGRDMYALFSRSFLGSQVDLAEAYEWGQEELARITGRKRDIARRILPGATVGEAMEHLTADPARRLSGVDTLRAWMQEKSDAAVAALADRHFDIPAAIRTLECRIAPTSTGGIYYTGPSEDLTRPGRMWWAVPAGVTEFSTWRELSTVYHEGVPGHHLQIGQTALRREELNRWRRLASWVAGHGEGWALYAERLMADLGFLDDPGDHLGMLDSHSFRAVRVVIDIGFHCGFAAPAEAGGGAWTPDKAWRLLAAHSAKNAARLREELDRYLGWPGQASAYKLGERSWLRLRDEVRAREGAAFDLKAFHHRALAVGSVGLDVLRSALSGEFDH
ncbi:DUF885 domain-containing protein [Actinoallomurus sp. CA-150999]|uniref:DUF885 domain-containing protein n=1 Tax=Actinoallomurus sp. CA-150999 TaxID=3239887 RepID=UPI003D8B47D0